METKMRMRSGFCRNRPPSLTSFGTGPVPEDEKMRRRSRFVERDPHPRLRRYFPRSRGR